MKKILITLIAINLIVTTSACAKDEHTHDHAHGHNEELTLNDGKKWPIDAPLKQSMLNIHAKIKTNASAVHKDKLSNKAYAILAKDFDKEIKAIFANCKLPPAADQALHLILIDVMQGIKAMKGEEKGLTTRKGFIKVVEALDRYGDFFDHPSWKRFH
jgi:hypothetical protein